MKRTVSLIVILLPINSRKNINIFLIAKSYLSMIESYPELPVTVKEFISSMNANVSLEMSKDP